MSVICYPYLKKSAGKGCIINITGQDFAVDGGALAFGY